MALKINVTVTGEKEVERLLERLSATMNKQEDEVGLAAQDFVENFWVPSMPYLSGYMKNTTTSMQQGKGKAVAFTQTSQSKPGGYAIYPERGEPTTSSAGNPIKWQNPHFTDQAINAFAENYFGKIEVEIDDAIKR